MNILIAEDDPVSCRILERTLTSWNHEVSIATDGQIAWAKLSQPDSPSLAILDIMMPHMDGIEVCRKVRELSPAIPPYLILLSAMSTKDDVVKGIQAGANDYLTKPFHREELRVRVGVGVQMLELQWVLAERVRELEEALSQVSQLQGLLPICSYCKKVRDDQNYWQKVDTYISDRLDVKFSHGICPECLVRVKAEMNERKQELARG
ncbi:MAG: copR [Acidobacteria bacterium]|nr:copR [Acidobacteriota bacterium]